MHMRVMDAVAIKSLHQPIGPASKFWRLSLFFFLSPSLHMQSLVEKEGRLRVKSPPYQPDYVLGSFAMKYLSVLSAAIAMFAAGAHAADLGGSSKDGTVQPLAQSQPFAGLYVGAYGGSGQATFNGVIDSSEIADGDPEEAEIFSGDEESGAVYGGYIGYNFVRSRWLFGIELDAGKADISAHADDADANDQANQEIDWMGSVRVRLGALLDERSLIYVTGGFGHVSTKLVIRNDIDADSEIGTKNLSSEGFIGGVGFERMVTGNLSLRIEGLYFDPSDYHVLVEDELSSDVDDGDNAKVQGIYQIRAGLSYHF
jgi:outer membrane immunogenic protein